MKRMKRMLSLLLALVMVLGMLPVTALAEANQVRVIVENTASETIIVDGEEAEAPFYGELVNVTVDFTEGKTMMDYVLAALDAKDVSYVEENGYISDIGGLTDFSQGGGYDDGSGWMGSWNDWFVSNGFSGTKGIQAGDELRVMYTTNGGEDLGAKSEINENASEEVYTQQVENRTVHLSDLEVLVGDQEQSLSFSKDTYAYTVTVSADTESVQVLPTAANKQYQVKIKVGETEYRRVEQIPLNAEGDTDITVTSGIYGSPDGKEKTYTLTVKKQTVEPVELKVYVNISKEGQIVTAANGKPMAMAAVTLTGKASYTLDDVLKQAHVINHANGQNAYASEVGTWGLSLTKLWNDDSGEFGYQINGGTVYINGLDQIVSDGAVVDAYINQSVYPDNEAYAAFDAYTAQADENGQVTLTLKQQVYNEDYSTSMVACSGAVITIDGEETDFVTDSNGEVTVSFPETGEHVVSAVKTKTVSDAAVTAITAPVCVVTVETAASSSPVLEKVQVVKKYSFEDVTLTDNAATIEMPEGKDSIQMMFTFASGITAKAYYGDYAEEGVAVVSGSYETIFSNFPYGSEVPLTLVLTDSDGNTTEYQFTFVNEKAWNNYDQLRALKVEATDYSEYTVYQADAEGKATENTTVSNDHKYYAVELPAGQTQFYAYVNCWTSYGAKAQYSADQGVTWQTNSNAVLHTTTDGKAEIWFRIIDDETDYNYGWDDPDFDYSQVNTFKLWVTTADAASSGPVLEKVQVVKKYSFEDVTLTDNAATIEMPEGKDSIQMMFTFASGITAKAYYGDYAEEGVAVESGSYNTIFSNFPYGSEVPLTLILTDSDGNTTEYQFTFVNEKAWNNFDQLRALKVEATDYSEYTVYQADAEGKATENTTVSNDHKYYAVELPAGQTQFYAYVNCWTTYGAKAQYSADQGATWQTNSNGVLHTTTDGKAEIWFRIIDDETDYNYGWDDPDFDYSQVNTFKLWVTTASNETVSVESVSLNKTELALEVGGEETLTATVLPENATDKTVSWSVEGDAVTVADGKVTAVKEGTATVTVTTADGAKTASCTVTVSAREVTAAGLTNLEFSSSTSTSATSGFTAKQFAMEPAAFDPAVTTYTIYAPDDVKFLAIKATAAEGYTGTITAAGGTAATKELTSGTAAYLGSSGQVIGDSLTGNTVTITLTDGTVYTITIVRIASFKSLSIKHTSTGATLSLSPSFSRTKYAYEAYAPSGILEITVTSNDDVGMEVDSVSGATGKVPVWDENRQTTLIVTATNGEDAKASRDYTFSLTQAPNSIAVTKAPDKTVYDQGDTFDPAGMEVTAYFDDATVILSSGEYTISPSGALIDEAQVTITYRGVTTTQPINLPRLPGEGTAADPFTISTLDEAKLFRDLVNGGARFAGQYVSLTADLSIPADWVPVGTTKDGNANGLTVQQELTAFCGTFQGNNHTIHIASGGRPFFGSVGTGAYIQNLNIYGSQIAGNGLIEWYCTGQSYTLDNITLKSGSQTLKSGLLTGYGNKAVTIKNSTVESGVIIGYSKDQSMIGSFAGDFVGTIENCTSYATVYGVDHVGGIVGCKGQSMSDFKILNCTFGGTVEASGQYVGGISGSGYGGTAWGVANNAAEPTITGCTVTGSVSGSEAVGGILGAEHGIVQAWDNAPGSITDNTFTGTVSGSSKVGGVIGYLKSLNKNLTISGNSYPNGCGAEVGIGAVDYVDTNYENPTAVAGTTYVNSEGAKPSVQGMSKADQNRTDDPLGADAEDLCAKIGGKDAAVAAVEALISNIGTVTLNSKDAIDAALAAMNALTAEQQAQVTNASVLADAENAYGNLALADKILQPSTGGDAISSFTVSHGDSDYILRYDPTTDTFTALNAAIPNSTATTEMQFTTAKDTVLNFTPSFVGNGTDSFKIVITKVADPYEAMPLSLYDDLEEADPGTTITLVNRPTAADITTTEIPAGTYTLTMTYTQDGTVNAGEGASVTGLTLTKIADAALIAEAEAAINAIGDVTASSATAIKTARALYNSLTDEEKTLVTNYETLTAAESAYAEIQANFTGYRVEVSEEKTVEVGGKAQVKLTVSHNTETKYNAYRFVVTYDPAIVTYDSFSGTDDSNVKITDDGNGTMTIIGYGDAKTFEKLPILTFQGKANGDSQIQLTEAGIDNSAHAIEHNTAAALIDNAETFIHVGGYIVELSGDLIGEGIATPNDDYTFSVTDPNYAYTIKAYMMTPDGEVAVDVIDNGDGTYTIRNVTGKLRIVSSRVAKTFGVTVEGNAKDDVTLGEGAPTYLVDYEFSVTKAEGYTYKVPAVTIGGEAYQATQYETDKYRIDGTDVTGNIVITLNKTKDEEGGGDTPSTTTTITFVGEGSADVVGGSTQTAPNDTDFTFSISEETGYIYTVKIGEEGLQPNEEGVYTIPGAQITGTAITVTVDKESEVERTVEVNEYVKLDGKSIFLVTANGDVHEGNVLTYNTQEMYWSETYNAYAYLIVSDKSLTEVTTEAEAAIAEAKATKLTISYTGDINNTNQIDVNDAQLVYDMYNALYDGFEAVSIEKFLRADMNGSRNLTVEDSAAIVALVD